MDQSSRTETLDKFRNDEIMLLAASDVAARGLDIPDVSHIFNFDLLPDRHGPIREGACTACHDPHAGKNFRMLTENYPPDRGGMARSCDRIVHGLARLGAVVDVVHLGMGDDGHTASWPPGDPVVDVEAPVALSGEYRGHVRMTLTPTVVNAARHRLVLAAGAFVLRKVYKDMFRWGYADRLRLAGRSSSFAFSSFCLRALESRLPARLILA